MTRSVRWLGGLFSAGLVLAAVPGPALAAAKKKTTSRKAEAAQKDKKATTDATEITIGPLPRIPLTFGKDHVPDATELDLIDSGSKAKQPAKGEKPAAKTKTAKPSAQKSKRSGK